MQVKSHCLTIAINLAGPIMVVLGSTPQTLITIRQINTDMMDALLQCRVLMNRFFRFFSAEVSFNHRSVFPALFNSTVIDYWWRRPLTFRVYFRESGKRMVHCYLDG